MSYSNNGFNTCGTAALKPESVCKLVLVQGGSRTDVSQAESIAYGDARYGQPYASAASKVKDLAFEVVSRIEPLPEPAAKSCHPTAAQERVGVVACLGCFSAILLLATVLQALI